MSFEIYTAEEYDSMMDYVFSKEFNDWFNEHTKGDPYWQLNEAKKQEVTDRTNKRKAEWLINNKKSEEWEINNKKS